MANIHELFQRPPEIVADQIAAAIDGSRVATRLVPFLVAHYRSNLTARFVSEHGVSVQGGIFAGMVLPDETAWGDGDRLPKLLGSYEAELHPVFEAAFANQYAIIVNVGCAEGYYAVGAAMRNAGALVYAFDISEAARRICVAAGALNAVGHRLMASARCSLEDVAAVVRPGTRSLIIVDCEGAERELLRPELPANLAAADLVIECHDFVSRGITAALREHFSLTHRVRVIKERWRAPVSHPFLERLSGLERSIALCEFRPELMAWLYCQARAGCSS